MLEKEIRSTASAAFSVQVARCLPCDYRIEMGCIVYIPGAGPQDLQGCFTMVFADSTNVNRDGYSSHPSGPAECYHSLPKRLNRLINSILY